LLLLWLELLWLKSVLGLSILLLWLLAAFFAGLILCLKPGKLLSWTLLDRADGARLEGAYFETVISSVVAGILLMIPEISSDFAAILLLLPPIRRRIFRSFFPTALPGSAYFRFPFAETTYIREKPGAAGRSASTRASPPRGGDEGPSTDDGAFPPSRIQDADFEILSQRGVPESSVPESSVPEDVASPLDPPEGAALKSLFR
jgi:UPF0716 family protein affecting phage T7 exclusion